MDNKPHVPPDIAQKKALYLVIRDRQKVIFEEEVRAITSYNDRGVFDVLPEHENFIALIKDYIIVHNLKGGTQEIKIPRGVIKVYENSLQVYLISHEEKK